MGAEEGISLGTKVIITIGLCFAILTVYTVGSKIANKQTTYISQTIQTSSSDEFSKYDGKTISGYELWDLMREQSGKSINGQYFQVEIITNAFTASWSSDQSIADFISSDPTSANYVDEDWKFNCELIKLSNLKEQVVGIKATLTLE